ncbi:hypothetical protein [Leptospira dzoumogneensis]|uniref:Uncharacterized protein n=1 Tax=Leptospira dzoumogneensis TaxID=2484904 RepID=A0A4Z1AFU4_9LEPT|nr:hypothetical protein [Leptospira dzoumogneensis]TGN02893.1 hypothetical protein EHR06_02470 [Leptospira dzoumogneensis]
MGEAISTLFSLLIMWAMWHFLWKPLRLDILREELFNIRDSLFDLALDKKLSFEDQVYKELEIILNGTIRYAHRISFLSSLIFRISVEKDYPGKVVENRLYSGLRERIHAESDETLKKKLKVMLRKYEVTVARYMIFTSPTLIGFSIAAILYFCAITILRTGIGQINETYRISTQHLRQILNKPINDAEYQVYIGIQDKASIA